MKKERGLIAGVITRAGKDIIEQLEKAREAGADIAEIRVDLVTDSMWEVVELFRQIYNKRTARNDNIIPIIATIRRKEEGGNFSDSEADRLWLYGTIITTLRKGDMIDIELNTEDKEIRDEIIGKAKKKGLMVIVSSHNFGRFFPFFSGKAMVKGLLEKESQAGADIAKVAILVNIIEHVYALQDILNESEGRTVIIAMGERWANFRLLPPFLTKNAINYGAINGISAPGQPTVKELRDSLELQKDFMAAP